MRTFFPPLSLSLLALGAFLTIGAQDQSTGRPTVNAASRASIKATLAQMQGVWRLVELKTSTFRDDRRSESGYCLVSGNYLSLEVHVTWPGERGLPTQSNLITGVHRFELDELSNIDTVTMIGTYIDPNGRVTEEAPGKSRRYHVETSGNGMRLVREDEQTFVFERVAHGEEERDIFGRPIERPKETREPPPEDEEQK